MASLTSSARLKIKIILFVILLLNGGLWYTTHNIQPKWPGVPPVPSYKGSLMMSLSDTQFSYRLGALTLQNIGDTGGRVTPLKEYDYQALNKWFELLWALDNNSSHVPLIVAYYFGAVRDNPESIRVVIDYLAKVGDNPRGENWRWLAQAVFLAKYRLENLDLAMDLAVRLANIKLPHGELPMWARHMPAFILEAQGDKDAAIAFVEAILTTTKNLHPNEINFMLSFLEERLGVDVKKRYGLDYK